MSIMHAQAMTSAAGGVAEFAMTAGGPDAFTNVGFIQNEIGTFSPSDLKGQKVDGCYSNVQVGTVLVFGIDALVPQSFFTRLQIDGGAALFEASAADYSQSDGRTFWVWNLAAPFVTGNSYTIEVRG